MKTYTLKLENVYYEDMDCAVSYQRKRVSPVNLTNCWLKGRKKSERICLVSGSIVTWTPILFSIMPNWFGFQQSMLRKSEIFSIKVCLLDMSSILRKINCSFGKNCSHFNRWI